MKKKILIIIIFILLIITACVGFRANYLLSAVFIAVLTMAPFFMSFEKRSQRSRVITLTAVMCAFAVVGRLAFFMLPQVKPICAIVIITGICLGGEAGFVTGAMSAFVSNFYFGHGPHTPFQMLALATLGFLAGIIFKKTNFTKNKNLIILSVSGALGVFIVYGGLADISTILMLSEGLTLQTVIFTYMAAVPFNLINAVSTAVFLMLLTKPFTNKFNRIKVKYGI